jgi:prefoldin subunit 5
MLFAVSWSDTGHRQLVISGHLIVRINSSECVCSINKMYQVPDYTTFLKELKEKLSNSENAKKQLEDELKEYTKLVEQVKSWSTNTEKKGYDTYVDIGEKCYLQAHVPLDNLLNSLYVHIGLGYHVPITASELPEFVKNRKRILDQKISFLEEDIVNIRSDYEQV